MLLHLHGANEKHFSPPSIVPKALGTFCVWDKALGRDALVLVNEDFVIRSEDNAAHFGCSFFTAIHKHRQNFVQILLKWF